MRRAANGLVKGHRWAARLWTVVKKENWPEPVALTSIFIVELPGIEPALKSALNCRNAEFERAKRRESTRKYLSYAKGVDGINTPAVSVCNIAQRELLTWSTVRAKVNLRR
jgi:hypothetical protein